MEYNTQLPPLEIPEYGRNIQIMIDHCCTIQDREERNRCAKAIIQIMGQLNPHLRDVADFTHKLWDHLFIISKFRLDVDSPYPRPSAETFATKPNRVPYPTGPIRYRHYGRTIEQIIRIAKGYAGDEKKELTRLIANHMKKSYVNWNKDSVTDDIIIAQLKELSKGDLVLDETAVLASANDLRSAKNGPGNNNNNHNNNGNNNKHRHQHNNNNKHKHKNKHHNNRKHS